MINCYFSTTANGAPLSNPDGDPDLGLPYFNVTAYFDTGASGILLSQETADYLSVPKSYSGGQLVVYEDVGVGGSEQFNVSAAGLHRPGGRSIATISITLPPIKPFTTKSSARSARKSPRPRPISSLSTSWAIPAMAGKVVVMDPKPFGYRSFRSTGFTPTSIIPALPYRPATADTDPGIPTTNHHIRLSYASFDSFTKVTPAGAAGPTLASESVYRPESRWPRSTAVPPTIRPA